VLAVDDIRQAIGTGHRPHDHIAAVAAVPTVGSAFGHVLLPAKTATPSPAIAAFDVQNYAVDKHLK
jgi:hypothetical protein